MKAPSFDFSSIPFVSKARKFFKNRNVERSSRRDFGGISFSNEVYQETCRPAKNTEGNWRSPLSLWQKNVSRRSSAGESTTLRTSVRSYKYPWGQKTELAEEDERDTNGNTEKDEGIFTVELVKPHYGYLGLVLVGGADTPLQKHYVKDILPDSTASKLGSVRIGDELIEVNGHTLRGRTHSSALVVIRSLPPAIKILIERTKGGNKGILSSFSPAKTGSSNEEPPQDSAGDPGISSPKARSRKRSMVQVANDSSIIKKSVSSIIDVSRNFGNPLVKPAKQVKRESRCTSFIGSAEVDDEVDVMSIKSCKSESIKQDGVDEDYDDRLSIVSNTSEWCTRQMLMSTPLQNDDVSDLTSTISLSTLSESLPGPFTEGVLDAGREYAPCQSMSLRHGSLRERRVLTESIIEVDSDEDETKGPNEPAMFLRRGSLRASGSLTLRRLSCIETQEDRATWPASIRRQRASLNWDTFVPPPEKPVRRSSSACIRPSSMYANSVPSNRFKGKNSDQTINPSRVIQRSNSTGKYIDKQTLRTKVYREQDSGGWGFTIAGGICSPYGDLPIHILDIDHSTETSGSLLKKGDEIMSFGGENFENITFLEAERKMKNFEDKCTTVIIKRKYLHRKKSQPCNTFADAWNEQAKQGRRTRQRPESFYY